MRRVGLLLTGLAAAVLASGCAVSLISSGNGISKDMKRVVETVKENGERSEITDIVSMDVVMEDGISGSSKYLRQFERLRKDDPSYEFAVFLMGNKYPYGFKAIDGVQWIDGDGNVFFGYVRNDQRSLVTHFVRADGDEVIIEDIALRTRGKTYSRLDGKPERITFRRREKGFLLNVGITEEGPLSFSRLPRQLQESIEEDYRRVIESYLSYRNVKD